jgi:hypothetical protein
VINVETVDLSARNVCLPADRVGMVIAQPFLSLTDVEPYRCTAAATPSQLAVLTRTLEVAREARHGAGKTHFTIFPEYSIPGLPGIALVQAAIEGADWPAGTIVIGGVDALSKQDFSTLAVDTRVLQWQSIDGGISAVDEEEGRERLVSRPSIVLRRGAARHERGTEGDTDDDPAS